MWKLVLLDFTGKAGTVMTVTMSTHSVLLGGGASIVLILIRLGSGVTRVCGCPGNLILWHHFPATGSSIRRSRKHHRDQQKQDDKGVQNKAAIAGGHDFRPPLAKEIQAA